MEGFVAHKLAEFEQGKISRRRLIETLTLAATAAYAADRDLSELPAGRGLVLQGLQPRPDRRPRQGRGDAVRQEG